MQSKPTLGLALALIGINGITFAVFEYLVAYKNQGLLLCCILLCCILFFAGITLLRNQISRPSGRNADLILTPKS